MHSYTSLNGFVPIDFQGDDPRPSAVEVFERHMGYYLRIHSKGAEYQYEPDEWSIGEDPEDSNSNLNGLKFQIGTFDFDKDGTDEIVVAWTQGKGELEITVIKYFPPKHLKDFGRSGNWQVFGPYHGQSIADLEGSTIVMPSGGAGLSCGYTWVKDRFIQTAD